jgi:mRNA-degrading endonuclease HigB of HigAB toxin-antitoxin module
MTSTPLAPMISLKPLREFWQRHSDAEEPLRLWYKMAQEATWSNLSDIRHTYPHADGVRTSSGTLTVFNIGSNKYRVGDPFHLHRDWSLPREPGCCRFRCGCHGWSHPFLSR